MEHWVREVCEPDALYLAWQAPDPSVRYRWAVGTLSQSDGLMLRYFRPGPEFEQYNDGRSYEEVTKLGFRGYPAFSLQHAEHKDGVEAALLRRLPPRSRSDFVEYAKLYRLPPDLRLSNLALLGRSEAKLPSDGFSLVDPLNAAAPACDLVLELAGYRYYSDRLNKPLETGEQVELFADNENRYDANAVAVRGGGQIIGYVNRLQAKTFRTWIGSRRVDAWIERLNGVADRPRAFMFVEVRPRYLSEAA